MAEPNAAGLPAKLYFRIGEVADLVGVEPHVLRYWEREFRAIRPAKSARGQRVYSRKYVENLMRVRELLYKEGFTIAGAKKKMHESAADRSEAKIGRASENESGGLEPELGDMTPRELGNMTPCELEEAPASDPVSPRDAKAREYLLAIRDDIEAFLAELDPARR